MDGRQHRSVNNPLGLILILYGFYGRIRIPFEDPVSTARRRAKIGRHGHDMEFETEVYTAKHVSIGEPISTAGAAITTTSVTISTPSSPRVSTADDISTAKKPLRLQAQIDEEERQRIAKVHEEASSFNIEEWQAIQARVEADEELAHRYSFDELKTLFKITMKRTNTFTPMESDVPKIAVESSKRPAEEELDQEILEEGMNIEAQQTKYTIIDWEVYTKDLRKYWKIIWVGNHIEHIHDITWRLYDTCGVHHVSTKDGVDIYMLVERESPLSRGVLTQMLGAKILVEQDNEMCRELLRKIFLQVERLKR
ncbi:hypothetical protein Tco_1570885 [Tanacetum coccineum]